MLGFEDLRQLAQDGSDFLPLETNAVKETLSDLEKVSSDLEGINALLQEGVSEDNEDRLGDLAELMENAKSLRCQKGELELNLMAHRHLIRGSSREDVLGEQRDEEWRQKHEVLTRWAWMEAQRERSHSLFEHLYQCRVGGWRRRQTLDREFYVLLKFVPALQKLDGREFLLVKKYDPPDFILEDPSSRTLGLEVTEAFPTRDYGFQEKCKEELFEYLDGRLSAQNLVLDIYKRPKWRRLRDNASVIAAEIEAKIRNCQFPPPEEGHSEIVMPAFDLEIWASATTDGAFRLADLSGRG